MKSDLDDLDELIRERTERDPGFLELFEAACRRRALIRELTEARQAAGLTQAQIAQTMESSQSSVARLETTECNPHASTLERYALSIGLRLRYELEPIAEASAE